MTRNRSYLFDNIEEIHRRPAPFEAYTAEVLWDDDHISEQMLAFHLDEASEPASRPHAFVQRSARWIAGRFSLGEGKRVVDFGCGPGLYTSHFAATGAEVSGIDISRRSLAHARYTAEQRGLTIDYRRGNYLDTCPEGRFDLITLIYCDLCPLSPAQRRRLLTTFSGLLAEGGAILLDVFSMNAFAERAESSSHAHRLMNGFWAKGDYWGFCDTFKYDEQSVVLDKYTIVEPHQTRTVYNWLQYFSLKTLAAELEPVGLKIVEQYSDVAGTPYDRSDTIAAVIQKR